MIPTFQKAESGIPGIDQLTGGGLPRGRPTLVCGGPGCGKTLMAASFLVHGAVELNEPGVLISFDERPEDLAVNTQSLGFDLQDLQDKNLLVIDYVHIERTDFEQSGEFDLEGLFIRINHAIESIGAKRVVLDTIDTLFAGLPDEATVRSELRRLFGWLKEQGLTTVITAERGEKTYSRHGIEEYVSDCVILLDHRVIDEISTRRLRVVKYRGTAHGTNEYPFLIGERGLTVLPVTSLRLTHEVSDEWISTGIAGLDESLAGKGYYKGSSVLISGGPGTGKSSLSAHFVASACRRGESCLYFSFEESPRQIIRNMRSIGIDLQPWIDRGRLHCYASRPSEYGLEAHLAAMHQEISEASPTVVVVDPMSAFLNTGTAGAPRIMMLRIIDYLKSINVTALYLDLQSHEDNIHTDIHVSSLMDTWLVLKTIIDNDSAERKLQIVKARGMAHPLHLQPMEITNQGVLLHSENGRK